MRAVLIVWLLAVAALGAVGVASLLADDPADAGAVDASGQAAPQPDDPEDDDRRPAGDAADEQPGEAPAPAPAIDVAALISSVTVFVLAVFVGFEVITKVPPTLHTPLMSGSNAVSGITIVGALMVAGGAAADGARIWGLLAVLLASINVVGGFLVTHRMLAMFSKPRRQR